MGGRQTELRHVAMIGRFCSIAYNIMAGVEEHPHDFLSPSPMFQGAFAWKQADAFRAENREQLAQSSQQWWNRLGSRFGKIEIGSDVWIGEGALIRRGVRIGDGAVIASRAVVTADVPPYAIVGGTPARILKYRFEPAVIDALLTLNWWSYGLSALHGVDLADIHRAIDRIDANIASGRARIYDAPLVRIDAAGTASLLRFDRATNELVPASVADVDAHGDWVA
ncbi:MAG: CatB-related O-acetyltransferase [Sphingomonadales bacterium]|nr:CatB-related O-acetyltransferase [Sphingomonadales bacterium]